MPTVLKSPRRSRNGGSQDAEFLSRRDILGRRMWRVRLRAGARVAGLLALDGAAVPLFAWLAATLAGEPWRLRLLPAYAVVTLAGQAIADTYHPGRARRRYDAVVLGVLLALIALCALRWVGPEFQHAAAWYAIFGLSASLGLCLTRFTAEYAVRATYRAGVGRTRALIIGSEDSWKEILSHLREERYLAVAGFFDPGARPPRQWLHELRHELERSDVQTVIVAGELPNSFFKQLLRECLLHGVSVSVVPGALTEVACRISSRNILGWPLLELDVPRLHLLQTGVKRLIDLVIATITFVLLLPLMAALAIAIRMDGGGSVLFRQRRLGLGGRVFTMYKFRTMHENAEALLDRVPGLRDKYVLHNYKLPAGEDPRVSRVGALLRRTSLDELPQLFNVIAGDMSLVGPRPIVPEELSQYGDEALVFLGVRPGVTGYWQVRGRSSIGYPDRARLELEYIMNWSLFLDFKILARTLPDVLLGRGAH